MIGGGVCLLYVNVELTLASAGPCPADSEEERPMSEIRLFVAEKKSMAEAIAAGLGNCRPQSGYIDCGSDWVTWCAGHLLEEYLPKDYASAWSEWKMDVLPMIPERWLLKPKSAAQEQLAVIQGLLKQAASVVNAGDPDREGQVLVDEVLERFNYKGPIQRIWLNDGLSPAAVKRALDKMVDNAEKAPLRDAARARSRADWLIGMNASRAMTLMAQAAGRRGVLPLGRVQTPALALVVGRDKQIEAFKPHRFYVPQALVNHVGGEFTATFQPSETQPGLDEEGRLVDEAVAKAISDAVQGASGTVTEATREEKTSAPPLPFSLSALQKAASSRFGMSAQEVLDAAQSLYLAKLTSYPRSDCRYLPENQHAEGASILPELAKLSGPLEKVARIAAAADFTIKSAAWNSKKQTAHHGIIPTGVLPDDIQALPEKQRRIYELVCGSYALQFHPPLRFEARAVTLAFQDTAWKATGRRVLEAGWTQFTASDGDAEPEVPLLPDVQKGDAVQCKSVSTTGRMTTPPARFTEGTLIDAMESVHKYVADDAAKATLRTHKGIGTEATRAGIIEGLKKRGLLTTEKKSLISTPIGRQLIELVPDVVKNPVTTADWEAQLEEVAAGSLRLDAFLDQICRELPGILDAITSLKIARMADAFPCPECKDPLKHYKGKDGKMHWACFNEKNHKSGKPVFLDDKGGKPVERKKFQCPECKGDLFSGKTKKGEPYFACFAKEKHKDGEAHFFDNVKGKPDFGGKK